MATLHQHDEAQRKLKERQWATSYPPGQLENALNIDADEMVCNTPMTPMTSCVQNYSFNLTGIVPPQPLNWKQVDHLYEDFKNFKWSCTRVF